MARKRKKSHKKKHRKWGSVKSHSRRVAKPKIKYRTRTKIKYKYRSKPKKKHKKRKKSHSGMGAVSGAFSGKLF